MAFTVFMHLSMSSKIFIYLHDEYAKYFNIRFIGIALPDYTFYEKIG